MPIYHQLGRMPKKRHVAFRKEDGGIHYEELVGNQGFTGPSSLLYHLRLPTAVKSVRPIGVLEWVAEPDRVVRHRHFRTRQLATGPSAVARPRAAALQRGRRRCCWCGRARTTPSSTATPRATSWSTSWRASGILESSFGELAYRAGDYVVIPRGILHRFRLTEGPHRFLVIESRGYVRTPKRYRNEHGQLTELAPYSERDIRRPERLSPHDETGEFPVLVKSGNRLVEMVMPHHPFDVVGWDGYYYPWAFSIHDFEPRVGRVHLPPPVHQTFEGDGFVICSFCPRPFDFDKDAVSAPVQPPERDVGRGALLRQRRVHEPQGHRARLDHAPPRRAAARAAARQDRGVDRRQEPRTSSR